MYKAFDQFLARDTWHTTHPLDHKAFYEGLANVVESPDFSPEKMGDYFRIKHPKEHYERVIERYVDMASTVQEYLRAAS